MAFRMGRVDSGGAAEERDPRLAGIRVPGVEHEERALTARARRMQLLHQELLAGAGLTDHEQRQVRGSERPREGEQPAHGGTRSAHPSEVVDRVAHPSLRSREIGLGRWLDHDRARIHPHRGADLDVGVADAHVPHIGTVGGVEIDDAQARRTELETSMPTRHPWIGDDEVGGAARPNDDGLAFANHRAQGRAFDSHDERGGGCGGGARIPLGHLRPKHRYAKHKEPGSLLQRMDPGNLSGSTWGRYHLIERVAAGGMGAVYLARVDGELGFSRPVALKVMHAHLAEEPAAVERFLSEARLASRISHPHVVSVLDVGRHESHVFLALDYVHGESFSSLLRLARARAPERPPLDVLVAITCDFLEGLHAAHELTNADGESLALVHRDVSPHNVMVSTHGSASMTDFGVAKIRDGLHLTDTGAVVGKAGYMAPEQVLAKPLTRSADVYGAGIVLWEALTGRKLYSGLEEQVQVAVTRKKADPPGLYRDDVPAALDHLVLQMLAADPAARPATARAAARELAAIVRPAHPSRVAEWVLDLAQGPLDRREALLRSGLATAPPAALEPAAAPLRKEPSLPETAIDVALTELAAVATEPSRAGRAGSSRTMLVGLAVLTASALALAGLRPRESAVLLPTQPVAAMHVPELAAAPAPAPSALVSLPLSGAPVAAAAASVDPTVKRPTRATTRTGTRAPQPPPPAVDCSVPYVMEGNVKHWRRECFRGDSHAPSR